jgi:hypothetical protein
MVLENPDHDANICHTLFIAKAPDNPQQLDYTYPRLSGRQSKSKGRLHDGGR